VSEAGALLGVPEHRPQQRVDVDEGLGLQAGQQVGPLRQIDQVCSGHRRQLHAVAMGELAQELAQSRRCVDLVEDPLHPTGADFLQIVDTVRAGGHPRDHRGHLARWVDSRRGHPWLNRGQVELLGHQLREPGLFGQRHHRHQTGIRHDVLVIEQWRGFGPCVR
jgi:hypothetical protein